MLTIVCLGYDIEYRFWRCQCVSVRSCFTASRNISRERPVLALSLMTINTNLINGYPVVIVNITFQLSSLFYSSLFNRNVQRTLINSKSRAFPKTWKLAYTDTKSPALHETLRSLLWSLQSVTVSILNQINPVNTPPHSSKYSIISSNLCLRSSK